MDVTVGLLNTTKKKKTDNISCDNIVQGLIGFRNIVVPYVQSQSTDRQTEGDTEHGQRVGGEVAEHTYTTKNNYKDKQKQ